MYRKCTKANKEMNSMKNIYIYRHVISKIIFIVSIYNIIKVKSIIRGGNLIFFDIWMIEGD